MSVIYDECHRRLQDRHGTRPLADRLEQAIIHEALTAEDQQFIETRDLFFLSTVDPRGRPTVSYKGGPRGFVRVRDGRLLFPCYDGNGMFYSMGNIAANPLVGLLFIDFETPHRLRVQGEAVLDEGPDCAAWPGAVLIVRVRPTHVFVNCGRYIHRYQQIGTSRYVPAADGSGPVPAWKRIEGLHDALPARDKGPVEEAGLITEAEYAAMVASGQP